MAKLAPSGYIQTLVFIWLDGAGGCVRGASLIWGVGGNDGFVVAAMLVHSVILN